MLSRLLGRGGAAGAAAASSDAGDGGGSPSGGAATERGGASPAAAAAAGSRSPTPSAPGSARGHGDPSTPPAALLDGAAGPAFPPGPAGPRLPNPYYQSSVPRAADPEGPVPDAFEDAKHLATSYLAMLDRLPGVQERLEEDQERLALMLQDAQTTFPPDEELDAKVLFFRDGMELRIREFCEDCRRLAAIERRLARKLDDAEASCEASALRALGNVDPRLLGRLEEQRRIIRLQQDELEEVCFERDVLMDEVLRLKCDLDEYDPAYDYGDDSFAVEHALRLPGPLPALPASRDVLLGEALEPEPRAGREQASSPRTPEATPEAAREGLAGVPPEPWARETSAQASAAEGSVAIPEVPDGAATTNRLTPARIVAQPGSASSRASSARGSTSRRGSAASGRSFIFG